MDEKKIDKVKSLDNNNLDNCSGGLLKPVDGIFGLEYDAYSDIDGKFVGIYGNKELALDAIELHDKKLKKR